MSAPRRPAAERTALVLTALALALLPWLLHHGLVSSRAFLYPLDAGQSFFARLVLLGRALETGTLPLWQDLAYAGSPFLANPENPVLYPPALLAALLPPVLGLNLLSLGHLSLAALGALLAGRRLARRAGLDERPALAAGLAAGVLFALNGYTRLEHLNLVTYGAAHALLPWIVLAVDDLLLGPTPRRSCGALALLLTLQVTTGGLYVVAYTALGLVLVFGLVLLGGDGALRRRALLGGGAAALLAVVASTPRWQPVADWVALTNRSAALPLEEARSRTLGGPESFVPKTAAIKLGAWTGLGLGLFLAIAALRAPRPRWVVLLAVLLLLGLVVAAGPGYAVLHAWVPPFDHVRNALRGWTLVNLAWPLLAALTLGRLAARSSRPLLTGVVAAALAVPLMTHDRERARETLEPWPLDEVLELYPNWRELAGLARRPDDQGRVAALNVRTAGSRNEQFISAALGVESPAGFMGYAYPLDLARHLYTNDGPLEPRVRLRRCKALAVHHATLNQLMAPRDLIWETRHADPFPGGVDGPLTWSDPAPRPRAWLPSAVVAVVGDTPTRDVLYTLHDLETLPLERVSLVSLAPDDLPDPTGWDAVVLVQGPATATPDCSAWIEAARAAGAGLVTVGPRPRRSEVLALNRLARDLADLTALRPAPPPPRRRSDAPGRVTVTLEPADGPRWLVLAETWHLWGGWDVRVDGEPVPLRRADGIATALRLPAGATRVEARYDPPGVGSALVVGALGALLALLLWLVPARRRGDG